MERHNRQRRKQVRTLGLSPLIAVWSRIRTFLGSVHQRFWMEIAVIDRHRALYLAAASLCVCCSCSQIPGTPHPLITGCIYLCMAGVYLMLSRQADRG